MAQQNYSREYLQNLVTQHKTAHIDYLINAFVPDLRADAARGKTTYVYEFSRLNSTYPAQAVITIDDLIERFHVRFPNCQISYQEKWSDTTSSLRILKRGILIDWS